MERPKLGTVGWVDLTVEHAAEIQRSYSAVAGWEPRPVAMGSHSDWVMHAPGGEDPVAGICHSRGVNAGLPPLWLISITVNDLDGALERCGSLARPRQAGVLGEARGHQRSRRRGRGAHRTHVGGGHLLRNR